MNEIDQATNLSDIEELKRIVPQWKQSTPEPFLRSVQQDVVPPTWNKLDMDAGNFLESGGNTPSQATIRGITILNGLATYVDFPGTPAGTVT